MSDPITVLAVGKSAVEATRGLQRGGRIVGITKGEFSLLDMIRAALKQTGPAEVTVSTWTPGAAEMDSVCDLLRTKQITHFRLLVDRSFPTRQPQYVDRMKAILPATDIRMTRTHAKFALISGNGWKICIRTSMNFNANPRLEQFDLDDDPAIFDFFDGLVDTLFAAIPVGLDVPGPTINRAFSAAFTDPDDRDPATAALATDAESLAELLGIE